jgi:multisubunit Na+/H+ antiporter MnhE subunit
MRWVRLILRVFGWLLTPFLAWAASFFGAVIGALVAMRLREPRTGLLVTGAIGAIAGFLTILVWLRVLRRSRHVREVLAVQSDGTPDIVTAPGSAEARNPGS